MPLLWRYLMRGYFKVFGLCVLAFISVLMVMRFTEIAQFAASGAPKLQILLFMAYLIPYILPLAIPISCLIAAILLVQRLSHTHELTALRAAGINLNAIAYPLLLVGALLSLANFTVASEIGPLCRGYTKQLVYEITTKNPLFLLQKDSLIKMKNIYYDIKLQGGAKHAKDVIIVMKNSNNNRLSLMTAKELSVTGEQLKGFGVCMISNIDSKEEKGFDHLVIENQESMSTKAANLSQGVQKIDWITSYDYMPLKMILAKKQIKSSSTHFFGSAELEIARRASIALAAFTFTFIGIAYGMQLGRIRSKKGIAWAIGLALFYMVCFIGAKSMRHSTLMPILFYLLPHPLILFLSLRTLKNVARGVE